MVSLFHVRYSTKLRIIVILIMLWAQNIQATNNSADITKYQNCVQTNLQEKNNENTSMDRIIKGQELLKAKTQNNLWKKKAKDACELIFFLTVMLMVVNMFISYIVPFILQPWMRLPVFCSLLLQAYYSANHVLLISFYKLLKQIKFLSFFSKKLLNTTSKEIKDISTNTDSGPDSTELHQIFQERKEENAKELTGDFIKDYFSNFSSQDNIVRVKFNDIITDSESGLQQKKDSNTVVYETDKLRKSMWKQHKFNSKVCIFFQEKGCDDFVGANIIVNAENYTHTDFLTWMKGLAKKKAKNYHVPDYMVEGAFQTDPTCEDGKTPRRMVIKTTSQWTPPFMVLNFICAQ